MWEFSSLKSNLLQSQKIIGMKTTRSFVFIDLASNQSAIDYRPALRSNRLEGPVRPGRRHLTLTSPAALFAAWQATPPRQKLGRV